MDITRNWRLKSSRSQLLAARRANGDVMLPNHSAHAVQPVTPYAFDLQGDVMPLSADEEYAHAAR